jgi:hypothetical protein
MDQILVGHYMEIIHTSGVTAEPWGRDRVRVEALLAELYRLGERPTRSELARFLDEQYGTKGGVFRKTILDLWSKRLRRPHGRWRGGNGWRYPFIFADEYVTEHGLQSVATRLANVVAAAAAELAGAIDKAPASEEACAAADELRAAAHALEIWHLIQDRPGDEWLGPGVIPGPRPRAQRQSIATRRGRARNPYMRDRDDDSTAKA